jgi:exodeoxyribonuclease VII small subunit
MTYDEALAELRSLLSELQEGQTGLEELSVKVKRAAELVQFCKEKLRSVEEEVERLADGME